MKGTRNPTRLPLSFLESVEGLKFTLLKNRQTNDTISIIISHLPEMI